MASKSVDRDALKKFYFSRAANFSTFKSDVPVAAPHTPVPGSADHAADVSVSQVHVSIDASPIQAAAPTPGVTPAVTPVPDAAPTASPAAAVSPAKVGLTALRHMSERADSKKATATKKAPPPNAASAEYFEFLKQQQEVQNHHGRLEKTLAELIESRRSHEAGLARLRRQASDLVHAIENGPDWKLKSKYDVPQLLRDCSLTLQPCELYEDRPATTLALEQLATQMQKIKSVYGERPTYHPHALFVDQSLRRLALLGKAVEDSNLDATELARVPDTLTVQLDKVNALPTVEALVDEDEESTDKLTFRIDTARRDRATAVEDGEVHTAEQLCYDIVEFHESMLKGVLHKIETVDGSIEENDVMLDVHETYAKKAAEELSKVDVRGAKLKERCADDVKKLFALREKIEEVEAATAAAVAEERRRSDGVLVENTQRQEEVFAQMAALEKELEVLERERHREVQKRIAEKDKDEHRRAEFARFCEVMEAHLAPLERTMRNVDVQAHLITELEEVVRGGFASLEEDLKARGALLREVELEAHKQHVEVFRGLLLELGEVVYKKERMVEETDKSIQQAHVQQELLAETFNPNARKFGDVKKKLLANRGDLEQDIKELKERAAAGLANFAVSETALEKAEVEFVHPVTEVEHHTLALRTRMVEFKAAAAGHVDGRAVMRDIATLKEELHRSKAEIDDRAAATNGTINRTLPMIRAAQKAREK